MHPKRYISLSMVMTVRSCIGKYAASYSAYRVFYNLKVIHIVGFDTEFQYREENVLFFKVVCI